MSRFEDPSDGQFDTSEWLGSKSGFLPVPIIITEPAVGYGGGAALAYFHPRGDAELQQLEESGLIGLPPTISVAFGSATENGSWLARRAT